MCTLYEVVVTHKHTCMQPQPITQIVSFFLYRLFDVGMCIIQSMMTSSNRNIFRITGPCAGNSPVTGKFLAQRPVTRSFDVLFYLRLNKRLSKQWWCWWFETPSHPLLRHCNGQRIISYLVICHDACPISNQACRLLRAELFIWTHKSLFSFSMTTVKSLI